MPYKASATSHTRWVQHRYKSLTYLNYKVPIGRTSTSQTQINTTGGTLHTHPDKSGIHPTHTLTQNPYGTLPTPNLSEGNYTTPVQWL